MTAVLARLSEDPRLTMHLLVGFFGGGALLTIVMMVLYLGRC